MKGRNATLSALSIIIILMVGLALYLHPVRALNSKMAGSNIAAILPGEGTYPDIAAITQIVAGNFQEQEAQDSNYGQLDFIDSSTGFLTTNNDQEQFQLLKTVDGGHTWNTIYSGPRDLLAVHFFTEQNGLAIDNFTNKGILVDTTDGGADWTAVTTPFKNSISLYCVNRDIMFVLATDREDKYGMAIGALYRTTDGGKNWVPVSLPQECPNIGPNYSMSWLSASEGFFLWCSEPGAGQQLKTLYHTTDGGKTWLVQFNLPNGGYGEGLEFLPDGTGFIGEERGPVYMTTDFGRTWRPFSYQPEYDGDNRTPDFLNAKEGYAINRNQEAGYVGLIHTIDGGKTWELLWPPSSGHDLIAFSSISEGYGVALNPLPIGRWFTVTTDWSQQSMPVPSTVPEPVPILERTDNGGLTWTKVGPIPAPSIDQLGVQDNILWAQAEVNPYSAREHWLLLSSDGGQTWRQAKSISSFIRSVSIPTPQLLYVLDDHDLSQSVDGGQTWQEVPMPEPVHTPSNIFLRI